MKKNNIIKKTVKPKNNYFKYTAMVLLVVFAAVGVSQILGFEINKDTTVCMDKKGNLFVPLDKEGNIDSCGKHDGEVIFNFDGGSGGSGTIGGGVVFMYMDGSEPLVLKDNRQVWRFRLMEDKWVLDEELNEKIEISDISDISQWYGKYYITNNGEVYMFENGAYIPKSFPTQ